MEFPENVAKLLHPEYSSMRATWSKWRSIKTSGDAFIEKHLNQFTTREDAVDFANRKKVTYCPAFAKSAIVDVKNSIFQRMGDIVRKDGTDTYQAAVEGRMNGVDLEGSSMNFFLGNEVLPEMLFMQRVGIFIDNPNQENITTLDQVRETDHPYLYIYPTESILNWKFNKRRELVAVLLQETQYKETESGLPTEAENKFRYLRKTDEGVLVEIWDKDGIMEKSITLDLDKIPMIICELTEPLLQDVSNYQIALLNISSADVSYCIQSNFPLYVEQAEPRNHMGNMKRNSETGEEVNVGVTHGRIYGGESAPSFIHPSPEPLRASIEKQEQIKREIRQIINLSLAQNLSKMASKESKEMDERGLESGLSHIGLELEQCENRIASVWADYESSTLIATISYPKKYNLRTDEDRYAEADKKLVAATKVPSVLFKKEAMKDVVDILIGDKISYTLLEQMKKEIDEAEVIIIDPEILSGDLEAGLVDKATASKAKGYPVEAVLKADEEHKERLERIAAAQTRGGILQNAGARGLRDAQTNENDSEEEKEFSRNTDKDDDPDSRVRGEGK